MVNTELIKTKSQLDKKIKRRIITTATAVAVVSLQYSSLGRSFQFTANKNLNVNINDLFSRLDSGIFDDMSGGAMIAANLSYEDFNSRYGLSYRMDANEISDFMAEDIEGENTEERITKYTSQLKSELETYIAVGIALGFTHDTIMRLFTTYLSIPYAAPPIRNAMTGQFGQFSAIRLAKGEMKYGRGRYASGYSNLTRLEYDMTQRAYTRNTWLAYRNSSFPCEICDDLAGRIFPMDSMVIPAHPRCVCGATPVVIDGSELEKDWL